MTGAMPVATAITQSLAVGTIGSPAPPAAAHGEAARRDRANGIAERPPRPDVIRLANGNSILIPAAVLSGTSDLVIQAGGPPGRQAAPLWVDDAPGCDLRPDPGQASTGADLVAALREFREWAGDPPLRQMASQCGQLVSYSTLNRALASRSLPAFKAVIAVITGCGGTEEDTQRYATAWRRIRASQAGRPTPAPAALRVVPPPH